MQKVKSPGFYAGLSASIFIFLVIGILAIIRPVYLRVWKEFSKIEQSLIEKIQVETGLKISYDSLSPSVLTSVKFNRIIVSDIKTDVKIAEIRNAKLAYNISEFFSDSPVFAFDNLSLSGVVLEYDGMKNMGFTENLSELFKKRKTEKTESQKSKKIISNSIISFEGKTLQMPLDITVKNLSVHYSDKKNEAVLAIKNLIFIDYEESDGVTVKSSGTAVVTSDYFKDEKQRRQKVGLSFSVSGILLPNLTGSSAFLSLSGVPGCDYSVSNLDMLVNLESDSVQLRTMRTALPFSVFSEFNFKEGLVNFSGNFDNFDVFSLVSVRRKTDMMKKINGTFVSGTVSASYSKKDLDYNADLSVLLPKHIAGDELNVILNLSGNKNYVKLKNVAATSSFVNMEFSGDYNIKSFQPSGTLTLNYFMLKNGGIISSEFFIEPRQKGFICFAPELLLGEKSLTAIEIDVIPENNSIDFSVSASDYSHYEYGSPASVNISGSFLRGKNKFVQANVDISDLFIESAVNYASFFMENGSSKRFDTFSKNIAPYIFTTELYISSDFKDFSFNAEQVLLTNSLHQNDQLLRCTIGGSNQTMQISNLEFIFGNNFLHASAGVDFSSSFSKKAGGITNFKDFSFFSEFELNSIPYQISGNVSPEWISIAGDYGFESIISTKDDIFGSFQFRQVPFKIGKNIWSVSSSLKIESDDDQGIVASIDNFELEESSGNLAFSPKFNLSGSVTQYGFTADTLVYSDNVSVLEGNASIRWNINRGLFDSVYVNLDVKNPVAVESVKLSVDFTNPGQLPLSLDSVINEFYISASGNIDSFPLKRFVKTQNEEDSVTANFNISGTVNNPYISVNVQRFGLSVYGYTLTSSGSFFFDDSGLNLDDLKVEWATAKIYYGKAYFNPKDFSGSADLNFSANFMGKSLDAPLNVKFETVSSGKKYSLPDFYNVEISSAGIFCDYFSEPQKLDLTLVHTPGQYTLMTESQDGFTAMFLESGKIHASSGNYIPVKFEVDGTIVDNNIDIDIHSLKIDLHQIFSTFNVPFVSFQSGILSGGVRISGITTDPEIAGQINIDKPSFVIPYISTVPLQTEKIVLNAEHGGAAVKPTPFSMGKGAALISVEMEFNRWALSNLDLHILADQNRKKYVPLNLSFPYVHAKGNCGGLFNLSLNLPNEISISGSIIPDTADIEIVTTSLQSGFSLDNISASLPSNMNPNSNLKVYVDLKMTAGQKVQLLFNPFLRALLSPDMPLQLALDPYGGISLDGDMTIRGGEIVWLNRNFYMKEGKLVFRESQGIDPRITVRAEARERDSNGNRVAVVLSARNQLATNFNPSFSSTPAKSEKEIMELLGQVVSADSDDAASLALAGGDYFMQATVMRRVENALREVFNFDIFSVRTNVLQNSLKQGLDSKSESKQITIGNFIDNSTVYIGKYFGSSMYVDTLLHWSYDENKVNSSSSNGIVFQPEFGLEMASPFVNIRLGVAPKIESIQQGMQGIWVPATSMTLSWKYSF